MLVLGLQGSPRKKGNTNYLLSSFLEQARDRGARTLVVDADKRNIKPCKELIVCEKKGFCPLDDDMSREIYGLLWEADVVVAASPIFFYSVTAQLKALIDRSQTLWARKYRLKLEDPGRKSRKGFLLALGATRGKNLFEGVELTAKYFYDAVGATYEGSLTYRRIEHPGDMEKHPEAGKDVADAVDRVVGPLAVRKKVLFACRENACRSQMAAAFARFHAGDKLDVMKAGSQPAAEVNPMMVAAMAEKGIDLAFQTPRSIESAIALTPPDLIVTMGCGETCPVVPGAKRLDWDLPDPAGQSMDVMRRVRDEIEAKVLELMRA